MNKNEAIELGREWLANSPPFDGVYVGPDFMSGLAGDICRACCRRIVARGCNLRAIASAPIWDAAGQVCSLCESEPEPEPEPEPMYVSRSMAMDAGMPEIEGMRL